MSEYLKVVRLCRKPEEKSEAQKKAERTVEKFYLEHPDNPFINIGAMMEKICQQMMRDRRERESGFVLDNSHRRLRE